MDIDKKIEELRKEFNEKIDKLKSEYKEEKNLKWIPKKGDRYYYITNTMEIDYYYYRNYDMDKAIVKYNKVFKTEEEAQEYVDYLKAKKEYSYEFSKEEWEKNTNTIYKHYIYYDFNDKVFYIGSAEYYGRIGTTYFKTHEKAQEFIDKYKKQILKFEFGIEEE